jgi:ubiquinone biosynthesis protein COQ9
MTQNRDEIRTGLLVATLAHVPFDGWTARAMANGARAAGMDPLDIRRYFPGGAAEMVAYFGAWADGCMTEALAARELADLRIRERIALALRLRLEALAPHREAVRATLAWLAIPTNAPLAAKCLYRTVDAAWYGIGDKSWDFNFYTKRALLAAVVAATALYWLDDESEGSADTYAFMERRIADVMKIPRLRAVAASVLSRLPDPFAVMRAMVRTSDSGR